MGRRKKIAGWKKVIGYPLFIIYYIIKEFLKGMFYLLRLIFKAIFKSGQKGYEKKKHKKGSSKHKDDDDYKDDSDNKKQKDKEESKASKKSTQKGKLKGKPEYEQFKELKQIEGDFEHWENSVYESDSTIGIILGARGKGKSAIGMKMLENYKEKTGKNIYALGFKIDSMPSWITSIEDMSTIDDIKKDSMLLVDEGGITFGSRDSMSNVNKLLSKILLVARHKDLSVIFISQNSSNIDVNAIRQADYLLLKPSSLLQKDLERKIIQKIYTEASKDLKEFKKDKGLVYIYADSYRGFSSNPLPSFWSTKLSKSFDKVEKK